MTRDFAAFEARSALFQQYALGSPGRQIALRFSIQYNDEVDRLLKIQPAAYDKLKRSVEDVKKMNRNRRSRPVEMEWEEMLAEYDDEFVQFYTCQLVGEHIHRLLEKSGSICERTEQLILRSIDPNDTVLREKAILLVGKVLDLMVAFDFICSVIASTEVQSEDTIEKIAKVVHYFGKSIVNKNKQHQSFIFWRVILSTSFAALKSWVCLLKTLLSAFMHRTNVTTIFYSTFKSFRRKYSFSIGFSKSHLLLLLPK